MTSRIQSVVFLTSRPNTWTTTSSRAWLKKEGLRAIKRVDKTPNTLRYRIEDPKRFKTFRTKQVTGMLGKINLVLGIK